MKGKASSAYKAKYRIHLDDVAHPATSKFIALPDCSNVIKNAVEQVHKHLYKNYGRPQAVRSVTLILESMGGVAYTTGIPIDDMHKEIHLSLNYIANFKDDPVRFHQECVGVITHEMVHCFQHNCLGTAPGGLIEGIADYVRLKAGLAPPHWKRGKEDAGKKWDEGYQKTAFFLDWLEQTFGEGTISKMNAFMEGRKYHEGKFWHTLLGQDVESLWKRYLHHLDEDVSKEYLEVSNAMPGSVDQKDNKGGTSDEEGTRMKEFHA